MVCNSFTKCHGVLRYETFYERDILEGSLYTKERNLPLLPCHLFPSPQPLWWFGFLIRICVFSFQLRPSSSMNGIFHLSVRLSHCPSVTPFSLCSRHRIIISSWKFRELLPMTKLRSMQKVKVRGQRSRSQVKTQLNHFRTVTPVWIHIW